MADCSYVPLMSWQQFLVMVILLGAAATLVWRSSSKKHDHGCNCGCPHDHGNDPKQKSSH